MKKRPSKPFWEMTPAERDADVKKYDKPLPRASFKPLSKAERERFERARAGPTGAIYSSAAKKKKITLQVNEILLARMDRLAEERGMTRDEIVERTFLSALMFAR